MILTYVQAFYITLGLLYTLGSHANEDEQRNSLLVHTFELKPWVYTEGNTLKGEAITILNSIRQHLDGQLTLVLRNLPWARALKTSQGPQAPPIALYPCSETPERHQHYLFSEPVVRAQGSALIALASSAASPITSLSELRVTPNIKIGVLRGHIIEEDLKALGIAQYTSMLSLERLFKMLLARRIDVVYGYTLGLEALQQEQPDVFRKEAFSVQPIRDMSYGFCLNKHSPFAAEHLALINQAIVLIRE